MINTSQNFFLAPGPYHLVLYANDTFGRINSTDVNFSVNEPTPPGPGSGGGGGSGNAGQPSQPPSLQNKNASNITAEEKFLAVDLRLINSGKLQAQLFIESSSNSYLSINYEIIKERIIYQEQEITDFKQLVKKDLNINFKNIPGGRYRVRATVAQDALVSFDEEDFIIEIETPLRIKLRELSLPFILFFLLLIIFIILFLLILRRKEEKKIERLEERIERKIKKQPPFLITQNPLGKKEYVRAIKKPLRKR